MNMNTTDHSKTSLARESVCVWRDRRKDLYAAAVPWSSRQTKHMLVVLMQEVHDIFFKTMMRQSLTNITASLNIN